MSTGQAFGLDCLTEPTSRSRSSGSRSPSRRGGVRKLGVPCVVDRLIQQALLQVLQARWDPTFSEHSYGFRPGRSAHQAVAQAQRYIAEGYGVVVDLDREKFIDRVNHDMLVARVAARLSDKRVLKLVRAFLKAGVMEDGLVSPVDEGTPQGGPLSPLLSNLVLDDLDKELTRRGHRFCRYAARLQYLCLQPSRRRAGDGLGEPVPDPEATAEGQPGQERGGAGRRRASSWVSASRTMAASGASRRKRSASSRRGSGSSHAGHGGAAWCS